MPRCRVPKTVLEQRIGNRNRDTNPQNRDTARQNRDTEPVRDRRAGRGRTGPDGDGARSGRGGQPTGTSDPGTSLRARYTGIPRAVAIATS
ncbi:hypothetical protein J2Y69_001370 [Microbacterium resistens]|uniref:Uncharacterized protein n=1 Tax=Microbacterium resistens TaxID=156977 RepID=A0ABU1SAY5_9MICO|nr:hypothetical protein [Microbacterium resistens]